MSNRRGLVDRDDNEFSVKEQSDLLSLNRTGLYYKPRPISEKESRIRLEIDKAHTSYPEYGYRRVAVILNQLEGISVSENTVCAYRRDMGLQAIYPRQKTSVPNPQNKIYPYLLNKITVDHPNQVWEIDITYVPIKTSWLYLVAIIDLYSRYIVSWKTSDTLAIDFVLDACEQALTYHTPEIINSDQGSHFTSPRFQTLFLEAGSKISMDHKGRAFDNIFIERFWRTIKYENIYPRLYETPREARIGIGKFITHYNFYRPHSCLNNQTPAEVYGICTRAHEGRVLLVAPDQCPPTLAVGGH